MIKNDTQSNAILICVFLFVYGVKQNEYEIIISMDTYIKTLVFIK